MEADVTKTGELALCILRTLRDKGPQTADQLIKDLRRDAYSVRRNIYNLTSNGRAEAIKEAGEETLFQITRVGRMVLTDDSPASTREMPRTPYTGAELRPYEGRPGALDAFTLPSLVNGRRTPRAVPALIQAAK